MAEPNPTPLNIETLNQLAGRLRDHAEDLADALEFEPVTADIRLAARACGPGSGSRSPKSPPTFCKSRRSLSTAICSPLSTKRSGRTDVESAPRQYGQGGFTFDKV
jgi:hypothetical protein